MPKEGSTSIKKTWNSSAELQVCFRHDVSCRSLMNTKAHLERIAVAAAVLFLACGGDGEPAPPGPDDALVARDSAGVAILRTER
jgi:hypothetical protein